MTLSGRLRSALSSRAKQGRQRSLTPTSSGRQLVDFSSNDYLSLSTCPQLRSVLLHRLQSQPQIYGPASSRLLDGNTSAHEFLEQHLSTFFHAPSALLFNSGFDANVALFTTIPGPDDFVLYDALIHASVHDGMRASRTLPSRRRSFSHNSVQSLSRELQLAKAEMPSSFSCIFVAVEALYSMDGDTCPLQEMLQAVDDLDLTHSVYFILDEAHSTGTFGPCGRGWAAKLGVEDRIAIRLHTFGKAMASQGGALMHV